jgi:hypothetical protein
MAYFNPNHPGYDPFNPVYTINLNQHHYAKQ